jgi:CHAT domain-containing protein
MGSTSRALGKYEGGEGHVGFAQSLLLCGSRSVCLSMWKVDDAATAMLMGRFYENLLGRREGLRSPLGKAESLAEAKRWLRTLPRGEAEKRAADLLRGMPRGKNAPALKALALPAASKESAARDCPFAHPAYWAAFVLYGRAD